MSGFVSWFGFGLDLVMNDFISLCFCEWKEVSSTS